MGIVQRLTIFFLLVALSAVADVWTSIVGNTLDAEFVKLEGNTVYLKTPDRKIRKIKLSNLCKEDQERARQLASPFPRKTAPAEAPKADAELRRLVGKYLQDNRRKKVSVDELHDKIIGIYFSAHWCGPCRRFTPELVEFYHEMAKQGKPFEVIFVSSDHSKSDMYRYIEEAKMPWLILPYGDSRKDALKEKYKVSGIPTLIIIDSKGNTITENGRGAISGKGMKAYDAWQ